MAAQNRLRASIKDTYDEHLSNLQDERDASRTQAERVVIEEGLASLGYLERPTEPHEVLLWYVRRAGISLGFVGLAAMGYGVFGPRMYSLTGFGLTLGGFLLVAVEEFLDQHTEQMEGRL